MTLLVGGLSISKGAFFYTFPSFDIEYLDYVEIIFKKWVSYMNFIYQFWIIIISLQLWIDQDTSQYESSMLTAGNSTTAVIIDDSWGILL